MFVCKKARRDGTAREEAGRELSCTTYHYGLAAAGHSSSASQ